MNKKVFSIVFLLSGFLCISAKITLPKIFTNNMVMQQQTEAPVWGTATPNQQVRITTSWDHQTYLVKADTNGQWKTKLNTPVAGGPYEINISDGEEMQLTNILIGEVWLCSGQSNMEMTFIGKRKVDGYEQTLSSAKKYPEIRLFHIERAMSAQPLDDFGKTRGGWKVCDSTAVRKFSAVAYFFGRNLNENLNVPIGLISSSVGGTVAEAWTSGESLEYMPDFKDIVKEIRENNDTIKNPNTPAVLYNAMIHPMIPYSMRGVIWYQGEANCMKSDQYKELFPLLIRDWRKQWGTDFPFYFVQLANFGKRNDQPEDAPWARLREAQFQTLHVENTAMAVTIDVGEGDDVHPVNKQDVGLRLALSARANTYKEPITYSGPLYKDYRIEGNKIRISFSHTDSGLIAKGGTELKGFAIAGSDHQFHWAEAKVEGNEIVVSSPQVIYPVSVRYAWAADPECNLYNGAGLPASPFRIDNWK